MPNTATRAKADEDCPTYPRSDDDLLDTKNSNSPWLGMLRSSTFLKPQGDCAPARRPDRLSRDCRRPNAVAHYPLLCGGGGAALIGRGMALDAVDAVDAF